EIDRHLLFRRQRVQRSPCVGAGDDRLLPRHERQPLRLLPRRAVDLVVHPAKVSVGAVGVLRAAAVHQRADDLVGARAGGAGDRGGEQGDPAADEGGWDVRGRWGERADLHGGMPRISRRDRLVQGFTEYYARCGERLRGQRLAVSSPHPWPLSLLRLRRGERRNGGMQRRGGASSARLPDPLPLHPPPPSPTQAEGRGEGRQHDPPLFSTPYSLLPIPYSPAKNLTPGPSP